MTGLKTDFSASATAVSLLLIPACIPISSLRAQSKPSGESQKPVSQEDLLALRAKWVSPDSDLSDADTKSLTLELNPDWE